MREAPGVLEGVKTERSVESVHLLIAHDPWFQNFLQNLLESFRWRERGPVEAAPATFWPDVFVEHGLPWLRFMQSGVYHVLVLALIWAGSRVLALQPRVVPQPVFTHADVIYYEPSEYLPPLDTRTSNSLYMQKAEPETSAQPIISVPPEADNRSQTIIAPPEVALQRDLPLPNVVAWRGKPQIPIAPVQVVLASETSRLAPRMERPVIAPPPRLRDDVRAAPQEMLKSPQPLVIAPAPAVEADSSRRLGDLNIGPSSVIAPAPQLSLDEQRTLPTAASGGRSAQIIAPPPSMDGSASSRTGGGMIALSLHPAVTAPPEPVAGNRRGSFTATPEGHRGGWGTAGASSGDSTTGSASAGNEKANGSGAGKKISKLPSGLYVGKPSNNAASPVAGDRAPMDSKSPSVNPNLIASARPPRVSARRLQSENETKLSEEERAVFGNRKFYSLSLNMPNLNSAGGSWIIRFAALKPDSGSADSYSRAAAAGGSSGDPSLDDLSAPAASRKVDPAYPLELMRQNVGGTVVLYGVIHADGRVGHVRVLRGVDERLDRFASEAVAKWEFEPATKNGVPVDVEATFWIPFRPARTTSNF
ncbi:MAG: TonB family protein [Candidatus Sulfotelmatobacter sp.]